MFVNEDYTYIIAKSGKKMDTADKRAFSTRSMALFLLVSILFMVVSINRHVYWFDEAASMFVAHQPLPGLIKATSRDAHPPLYFLILKLLLIFSENRYFLRSFSAVMGVLSIVFIYSLARQIYSHSISLLIAIFYLLTPVHLYYSAEIRMYTFFVAQIILLTIVTFSLMNKFSKLKCALFIILAISSFYTHYYAILMIFSDLIILFWNWKNQSYKCKLLLVMTFAVLITVMPWIVFAITNHKNACWCFSPLTGLGIFISSFGMADLGLITLKDYFNHAPLFALFWGIFDSSLIFLCILKGTRSLIKKKKWLLLNIFYLPLFLAVGSGIVFSTFSPRGLIFLLPFGLLIFAEALTSFKNLSVATLLVLLIVIINVTVQLTNQFFITAPLNKIELTSERQLEQTIPRLFYGP